VDVGDRLDSIYTRDFSGDAEGNVNTLLLFFDDTVPTEKGMSFEPVPGSDFELPADLVLLAMGFVGPERNGLITELGVRMTDRGTVWRDDNWMTSADAVFTTGDMQRGQSLIVWAIADGRNCARSVDAYLTS